LFVVAHLFAYSTSEHLLSYSVQFYVWPMAWELIQYRLLRHDWKQSHYYFYIFRESNSQI
jgi:hypothetical protein